MQAIEAPQTANYVGTDLAVFEADGEVIILEGEVLEGEIVDELPTSLTVDDEQAERINTVDVMPHKVREMRERLGIGRQALHALGINKTSSGPLKDWNGYKVWAAEQDSKIGNVKVDQFRVRMYNLLVQWTDETTIDDDGDVVAIDVDGTVVKRPVAIQVGRKAGTSVSDDTSVKMRKALDNANSRLADLEAGLVEALNQRSLKAAKATIQAMLDNANSSNESDVPAETV